MICCHFLDFSAFGLSNRFSYLKIFHYSGNHTAYPTKEDKPKDTQTVNFQPPAVPAITVDELKEITENFGTKALIGEGSYGRVYYGTLRSGQAAALKKLDSSKQPDQEILGQVMTAARCGFDSLVFLCSIKLI